MRGDRDKPGDGSEDTEARRRRRGARLGREEEEALLAEAPSHQEDPSSGRNLAILVGCPTVLVVLLCLGGGPGVALRERLHGLCRRPDRDRR